MDKLPDNEYASFYAKYIEALVNNDKSIIENLEGTYKNAFEILTNIPKEKQLYSYAKDKWTIKQLIQHFIDAERVLSYRALRFARRDATDLAGFEEDEYVKYSNGNDRDYADLLEEFSTVRKSTIQLFRSFDENALPRIGSANGTIVSVRALGYIISGHLKHHLNIIMSRYI